MQLPEKLQRAKDLLEESPKFDCIEIANFASAQCIQCTHIATRLKCNLDFTNVLSVQTSAILSHLLSSDERIYDLAFIIKYWLKKNEIISPFGINSYVSMWLLVFFLQIEKILLPIEEYQQNGVLFVVDGYDITFNFNLNSTKNTKTLTQLLHGFFSFYKDFEFETHVLCPGNGQMVRRIEFDRNIYHNELCIEDPFRRKQLISLDMTSLLLQKFRSALDNAAFIGFNQLNSCNNTRDVLLTLCSVDNINSNDAVASASMPNLGSNTTSTSSIPVKSHDDREVAGKANNQGCVCNYDIDVNIHGEMTKRITIVSDESFLVHVEEYMHYHMIRKATESIQYLLEQFSLNFVANALSLICRSERCYQCFYCIPEQKPQIKMMITGLYSKMYKDKSTYKIATHPNTYYEIKDVTPTANLCHIYFEQSENCLIADIYGEKSECLNLFCTSFEENIKKILSAYFLKVFYYHVVFSPHQIVNISYDETQNWLKNKVSFEYELTHENMNCFQTFHKKYFPQENSDNSTLALSAAKLSIDFFLDILANIYAFEVGINIENVPFDLNEVSKVFGVVGQYDTINARKQFNAREDNHFGILFKETRRTFNMLTSRNRKYTETFRAIYHIWSDGPNYRSIKVDIFKPNNGNFIAYDVKHRLKATMTNYFEKLRDGQIFMVKGKAISRE